MCRSLTFLSVARERWAAQLLLRSALFTSLLSGVGCTAFKSYEHCQSDEGCAALTQCSAEGLCVPITEGELPEGIKLLAGELKSAERASVIGLLSRADSPALNQSARDGIELMNSSLLEGLTSPSKPVIWVEAELKGEEEGGEESLLERLEALQRLKVSALITPRLSASELSALQGALAERAEGAQAHAAPPLMILSYGAGAELEPVGSIPISAQLPVFAFEDQLLTSQGLSLVTELSLTLLAGLGERPQTLLLIYDAERAEQSAAMTTLMSLFEALGIELRGLARDLRQSPARQVSLWETLEALPDEPSSRLILWLGGGSREESAALLKALDQAGHISEGAHLEVLGLMSSLGRELLAQRPESEGRALRWWTLNPAEHEQLPSSDLIVPDERGAEDSLLWSEEARDDELRFMRDAFWSASLQRFGHSPASTPLLARSFDVAALLAFCAQYVSTPSAFELHLRLSELLITGPQGVGEQLKLSPSVTSFSARPSSLDASLKTVFHGLQGPLSFADQRALNLPLPHLSCVTGSGPLYSSALSVDQEGAYIIPADLSERCSLSE